MIESEWLRYNLENGVLINPALYTVVSENNCFLPNTVRSSLYAKQGTVPLDKDLGFVMNISSNPHNQNSSRLLIYINIPRGKFIYLYLIQS